MNQLPTNFRSHQRCSMKKVVRRNFAKFTGKHQCQSLFFNKAAGQACNFIKIETLAQVFFCKFCEISKNTFLQNTSRRLNCLCIFSSCYFCFLCHLLYRVGYLVLVLNFVSIFCKTD